MNRDRAIAELSILFFYIQGELQKLNGLKEWLYWWFSWASPVLDAVTLIVIVAAVYGHDEVTVIRCILFLMFAVCYRFFAYAEAKEEAARSERERKVFTNVIHTLNEALETLKISDIPFDPQTIDRATAYCLQQMRLLSKPCDV